AGRYNVFDREDPFPFLYSKSAAQAHNAVLTLSKNCPRLQHSSDFSPYNNPADCRRDHQFNFAVLEMFRDLPGKQVEIFRILQDLRTLKVVRAVQPRSEQKVHVKKRIRFSENLEYFFFRKFHIKG